MAYKFITAVNKVLKRAKLIQGTSGDITSFTDSPRQVWIDAIIQNFNEIIQQLYSMSDMAPVAVDEAQILLVEGMRDYPLPCNLDQLHYPLINEAKGAFIVREDYAHMRNRQLQPSQFKGQPFTAAISPVECDSLRLDMTPTATEAGDIYKFTFDKRIFLDQADDTFPFSDTVVDALIPVVTEYFNRDDKEKFDAGNFSLNFARAIRLLNKTKGRAQW